MDNILPSGRTAKSVRPCVAFSSFATLSDLPTAIKGALEASSQLAAKSACFQHRNPAPMKMVGCDARSDSRDEVKPMDALMGFAKL
jgi:hypothetical protein